MLPTRKKVWFICLSLLAAGVVAVVGSNLLVLTKCRGTYDQVSQMPHNKVGLVLGCVRYLNGGY